MQKCSGCSSTVLLIHFGVNRKGDTYKTCKNCRSFNVGVKNGHKICLIFGWQRRSCSHCKNPEDYKTIVKTEENKKKVMLQIKRTSTIIDIPTMYSKGGIYSDSRGFIVRWHENKISKKKRFAKYKKNRTEAEALLLATAFHETIIAKYNIWRTYYVEKQRLRRNMLDRQRYLLRDVD